MLIVLTLIGVGVAAVAKFLNRNKEEDLVRSESWEERQERMKSWPEQESYPKLGWPYGDKVYDN